MAKLCVRVGATTKKLDLDGGSSAIVAGGGTPTTISSSPYTATHTLEQLVISTSVGDTGSFTVTLNGSSLGTLGASSGKYTTVYNSITLLLRKNDVVTFNAGYVTKASIIVLIN